METVETPLDPPLHVLLGSCLVIRVQGALVDGVANREVHLRDLQW